ncbi:hypothetical protein N9263_01320 [Candidatus Marinimicrobia bacterium]|nr:hypothetical protein [Candidatus Neomarinimicrobiota bacterium]
MRCSLNIIKFISRLFILVFLMVGCEEESSNTSSGAEDVNTLDDSSLGLSEGSFSDYFFDLSSDFNAKFFYYQKDGPVANTVLNPGLLKPQRDTLNLRTFSDFILKVEPQDLSDQTSVSVFDETIGECSVISDSCPDIDGDGVLSSDNVVENIPQTDSLIIYSHQFSSILKLEWDVEDNRYKPILEEYQYTNGSTEYTSQWLQDSETVYVDDSNYKYDSLIYMTPLDTILTSPVGQFYFDQSEYIKRDSVYSTSDIELSKTFFFTRNILADDSVMYRVNTDCNLDGVWSDAEDKLEDYNNDGDMIDVVYEFNDQALSTDDPGYDNGEWDEGENKIFDYNEDGDMIDILYEFDDLGNGSIDNAEIFWDSDSDGERDPFEPFEDLNCNGVWDATESADVGNGIWDEAEYYEDDNVNGFWDEGEGLSKINDAAVNLVVDYSDPGSPQAVSTVTAATEIKLRGSSETHNPIESKLEEDLVKKTIPEIDSIRTTFSNKVISQIIDTTLFDRDYKILKSQYPDGSSDRNYSYNILDTDDDKIVRLQYPSYFLPYGFYTQPSQMSDGFWYESFLVVEPIFYTHNGNIREGEHVVSDSVYITSHGDYHVETDYFVERPASVIVPMKRLLVDENSDTCRITSTNPYPSCQEDFDLSSFDSTLTDCYSIIKTITMTMLGSGVEFGQRTTTTLAKNLGVVKENVEIRWSEQIGIDGQVWSDYSSIALNDLRLDSELSRSQSILNNLIGHTKINIEELNQLDGDPFIKNRSTGIQPVKLPSD